VSLHFRWTCAVERRDLQPGGRISQRKHRVACVDMVRARISPSRIESRKLGPGIGASPHKEIFLPNSGGAAAKDQERTRVDDPYYTSCYHKAGRTSARIARFLQKKLGIRKDWATSPRMIWRDVPGVTTEVDEGEISTSVKAPQRVTHRRTAAPLKTKGCATRVYYPQWVVRE